MPSHARMRHLDHQRLHRPLRHRITGDIQTKRRAQKVNQSMGIAQPQRDGRAQNHHIARAIALRQMFLKM